MMDIGQRVKKKMDSLQTSKKDSHIIMPPVGQADVGLAQKKAHFVGGDFVELDTQESNLRVIMGHCQENVLSSLLLPVLQIYILRRSKAEISSLTHLFSDLKAMVGSYHYPLEIDLLAGFFLPLSRIIYFVSAGGMRLYKISGNIVEELSETCHPLGTPHALTHEYMSLADDEGIFVLLSPSWKEPLNLKLSPKQRKEMSAQKIADFILDQKMNNIPLDADCSVLVIKLTSEKPALSELIIQNEPTVLPPIRSLVTSILEKLKFDSDRTNEVLIAVSEALGNAIRHGQCSDQELNTVTIKWHYDNNSFRFSVEDHGVGFKPDLKKWKPPDLESEKGRGVWLMQSLMDTVSFENTGRGTRVSLECKI